jgi:hypothetical protein
MYIDRNDPAVQAMARTAERCSSTTITFQERRRPGESFPDGMFSPENLLFFNPEIYGITPP